MLLDRQLGKESKHTHQIDTTESSRRSADGYEFYGGTAANDFSLVHDDGRFDSVLPPSPMSGHLHTAYATQFGDHTIAPPHPANLKVEDSVPDYMLEIRQQPQHARVALGKDKGVCNSGRGALCLFERWQKKHEGLCAACSAMIHHK